jgi:hypothetical protein
MPDMDPWKKIADEYKPVSYSYSVERDVITRYGEKDWNHWPCRTLAQALTRYAECDRYAGRTYGAAIYFTSPVTGKTFCIQSSEAERIERMVA